MKTRNIFLTLQNSDDVIKKRHIHSCHVHTHVTSKYITLARNGLSEKHQLSHVFTILK